MSRELDFIDYINEQASEEKKPLTNREILANTTVDDMLDIFGKDMLFKYQDTLCQLNQKEQELYDTQELCDNIYAGNDKKYLTLKHQLQDEAFDLASQRDDLERQLIELEQNPILEKILFAKRREKAAESMRELKERYQKSKEEELQKREQAQQQQEQEIIKEAKTPHPEPEPIVTPPKEEPKETKTIKSFLPSIPFSFLGLFEYYIIYGLSVLAIALVFLILSYIPIINTLVDWLFRIREDTPDMFAMIFAAGLAYLGTTATAEHIIKSTRKYSLVLTGIYLVILNIIFLIVNLVNSSAILPNIIIGIAGIVMFYKYKNE